MLGRVRPDLSPHDLVPAGADGLVDRLERYITRGISKFVLVPPEPPNSWDEELTWLSPIVRSVEAAH
jgi:hypothetical protein